MNEPSFNTSDDNLQPHRPRWADPLKAAQLHNFTLRLDLQRARRDLVGAHKLAAIDRLRSLSWLAGKPGVTHDEFVGLEQLAMELQAMPDVVGVAQ